MAESLIAAYLRRNWHKHQFWRSLSGDCHRNLRTQQRLTATKCVYRVCDGMAGLHNDVDHQMPAIRRRRHIIDKQFAFAGQPGCVRERQIQRPLHLPAELLVLPLRLTVGRWSAAAFFIENLCEVRVNELRTSFSTNLPFQNKAPLMRARAQRWYAHGCAYDFNW